MKSVVHIPLVTFTMLVFILMMPLRGISQEGKIILTPDTSDSYPFTYTRGIYTITMGYNTFLKNLKLDKNQVEAFKAYADSAIDNSGKVDLTAVKKIEKHCSDGSMVFLYVNFVGESMTGMLLNKGLAKVYNTVSKQYLKQLIVKKGKAKIVEDGREVKATALKYYDPANKTEIFQYVY